MRRPEGLFKSPCRLAVAAISMAAAMALSALLPPAIGQDAAEPDLAAIPPTEWLPEPVPVPNSEATAEAEMKAYTEVIPGTEVTFDMTPIPGGVFTMGSPEGEPNRKACEGPQFQVEVEPFWMATCEVTWEAYDLWGLGLDADRRKGKATTPQDLVADAITMPTPPYFDKTRGMGHDGYPAISLTQLAAKIYCKWLSAKTGRYYRLPTEAEWEYACRAGTQTAYSFGDDPAQLGTYAWYYENANDQYQKVGTKAPNPWGLYDMHGNVREWVLDAYTPDGYPVQPGELLKAFLVIPEKEYPRVVRGGSWVDDPEDCRSASRFGSSPAWKKEDPQIPQSIWHFTDADFVGFRVVRPLRMPEGDEALQYDLDPTDRKMLAEYPKERGR